MNINFLCTKDWIFRDVPLQMWEATTADGVGATVWLTRFLHNKPLFYLNNFLRCYLSYLSFDFLAKTLSILGLALFIFGLYQAIRLKKYFLISIVLISPIFPLLGLPDGNVYQGILLYGSQAILILFGLLQLYNTVIKKFHAS